MRERILVLGLAAWVVAVVSCAVSGGDGGVAGGGGAGSEGVVDPAAPVKGEGPAFDHAGHLARGVECAFCHGEEAEEWKSMPALSVCQECHEEIDGAKPPEKRAAASFDASGAGRWVQVSRPDPEIIFPHGAHVKSDADCLKCHADVAASTAVPRSAAFTMNECTACHDRSEAGLRYNRCESCHREIRKEVAPASHRTDVWRERHGLEVPDRRPLTLPENCALCHTRSSCDECHRTEKPASHRMNWDQRHGRVIPDRRLETFPEACALCHTRSSCDECHRAEKPRNHNVLWRRHGHAAASSLDRESCQACHRTDSCDECHQEALPANHRGTWGPPFDRHCNSCHLPIGRSGGEGCAVCHRDATGHDSAPPRPPNPSHMTSDPAACRVCHTPMPHPDNGQTCLFCHR